VARPAHVARLMTGALLLGAFGAALAPAGPDALVPFKVVADAAANEVYVAIVIDFGSGSSRHTVQQCVPVPASDTDAQALAVDNSVGYNNSGLLCSIDKYPTNSMQQCTRTSGSDFYYWSYWHGTSGSWSYADNGPAGQGVSEGDVEGWAYQDPGPANPTAPPPSVAPDYAQICAAYVDPTTTTSTDPGVTTTTATGVTSTSVPTQSGSPVTTAPAPTTGSKPTTSPGSAATVGSSTPPSTTVAVPAGSGTTTTGPVTYTVTPDVGHGTSARGPGHLSASAASHRATGSSGSSFLPVVVVGLVIVALGGLAFLRWRRRPTEE
jgi:hypothetical protein